MKSYSLKAYTVSKFSLNRQVQSISKCLMNTPRAFSTLGAPFTTFLPNLKKKKMCQSEYNWIPRFDFFSLNVHILTSYFVNLVINSVSWASALQEHTPGPASQACTHVVPLSRHRISSWRSLVLFSECYVALHLPCPKLGAGAQCAIAGAESASLGQLQYL